VRYFILGGIYTVRTPEYIPVRLFLQGCVALCRYCVLSSVRLALRFWRMTRWSTFDRLIWSYPPSQQSLCPVLWLSRGSGSQTVIMADEEVLFDDVYELLETIGKWVYLCCYSICSFECIDCCWIRYWNVIDLGFRLICIDIKIRCFLVKVDQ